MKEKDWIQLTLEKFGAEIITEFCPEEAKKISYVRLCKFVDDFMEQNRKWNEGLNET